MQLAWIASLTLGAAAQSPTSWTAEDVVFQERASGFDLSRDGRHCLWIRSRPNRQEDKSIAKLMLTDLDSGEHRELTVGQDSVSSPAFSPSGRWIAFLSNRKLPKGEKALPDKQAGNQLWVFDLRGGDARPISRIPFGVAAYRWVDDDTMYLSARERRTRIEQTRLDRKDDSVVVEDSEAFGDAARQLFRYDWRKRELRRVTSTREPLQRFVVSPDGRYAVALHGRSPKFRAESDVPPRCLLHDLRRGTSRELFADRLNKPNAFEWAPDSSVLYLTAPHSTVDGETWGAISVVFEVDPDTAAVRSVPLSWEAGRTGSFVALDDGFITGCCSGVRPRYARYVRNRVGWRRRPLRGPGSDELFLLTKARDADRVVFVTGRASDPDHVWSGELLVDELANRKEIYRPNDGFAKRTIAETEIRHWRGAEGDEIEGIVYYPHDYRDGERHPLVLITHGGPHGADSDRFTERYANSPNLYAQRGAFVLKTNYHGSSDYGLEFGESIKARYYELELEDMFNGIDMLVAEGRVDPKQLGLVGWSNGAILSIAALTHGEQYAGKRDYVFRAAAPGAGDVNWTSDYGNCAFGAGFDDFYLGGSPWDLPELYVEKSPLFRAKRITTPTIIFFGTEDTSVPTEQGWEWYRALSRVGKAPVRFVLFPGEPHGLRKPSHQLRKLREELAWFDKYLFGTEPDPVVAAKEHSPLDLAEQGAKYARGSDELGVRAHGVLVPETVAFQDGLEVGRFEVTRAQWQSFDPSFEVGAGLANYPVQDLSFEQAQRYVQWLSAVTGSTWRLLYAEEFDELPSGSDENTLAHWVGYPPSPTDGPELAGRVAKLGWLRCLDAVGSRPPGTKGDARFHDAGVNVAEWVIGDRGPEARGCCAVRAPDARAPDGRVPTGGVPAEFVGLRVARER